MRSAVVVDALLGTGTRGTPRPGYAEAIEAMNAVDGFVLSIDLPSGLNADTGAATLAVKADVTVSFIARKIGLYTGKGPALCGERLFNDLGVSETLASPHPSVPLRRWRSSLMPALPLDAFKQQRGHVLIVGGCKGMGGAAILAGEAALRSGAGLVTVATHEANLSGLLARLPEAMWVDPLGTDAEQSLSAVWSCLVRVLGAVLGRSACSRPWRVMTAPWWWMPTACTGSLIRNSAAH
jgi:NAD(P)H-hydrate epimerase